MDDLDEALVELGVCACASVLDHDGIRDAARRALHAGAQSEQLAEVLVTVSVLGFHSLTEGMRSLGQVLEERVDPIMSTPLQEEQLTLRKHHVGDNAYWHGFERELPGFLDALLRLAPDAFAAFFEYSALPWRSGRLAPRLKELLYVAIDAVPGHVYVPGLRLHAANARALGVEDAELAKVLRLAARGDTKTLTAALTALSTA